MPIIKSRGYVDELLAARDALAAANRDADALRRQLLQQGKQLDEHAQHSALLAAELVQAETRLKEVQSYAQVREKHHREQMHRMEQNVRTLEDMVQAARRSERERSESVYHCEPSAESDSAEHAERARRRAEVGHDQERHSRKSPASQRPPTVPARDDKSVLKLRSSPTSAQALYWQEQLLSFSQHAAEGFSEVQRQVRSCLPSSFPGTSRAGTVEDAQPDSGLLAASASLDTDVYRWGRQLRRLQVHFDEAVQADARLISFLLLVVQQQSHQVRILQERWAEAQSTVRDAETVLAEADARITSSNQESVVLRHECAALTEMQTTLQAQLTYRTREHQATVSALQRLQEAHTRQEEIWTMRLSQAAEVQQRANTYAKKLEAALLDKERLMSAAAASIEEQHRREALSVAKERVAVFMRQLNASAQQLQSALASLSSPTPSSALAASVVAVDTVKTLSSATSPDPSPPGASLSPHSSSPSAAALYSRAPISTAASLSPSSSPTFDESILLPESAPAAFV